MSDLRYGLNIGTFNISISSIAAREILVENNVNAIRDGQYVIGYGNDAYEMFEKAPENVEVAFPVQGSVISDLDKMTVVLEGLYKKLNRGKMVRGAEFLVAVPTDTTEVEKRAFHELVANSKIRPRSISVVEKCVADAISCGIDPSSPRGSLLVNIGADTTDIAVMSLGGIVLCRTLKFAGNRFNELIMNAVRKQEGKLIGIKSAQMLKGRLADFSNNPRHAEMNLFGRVMSTGLPAKMTIQSEMVTESLSDAMRTITEETRRMLEKAPPELAADIEEDGIYLLGGSSLFRGLNDFFEKETELKVNPMQDPANSTIRGVTKIFASPKMDNLRYYPEEKEYI